MQATEAAIGRYRTAFENGTIDDRTCGERIRDLTARLTQLTARRDDLTDLLNSRPQPPSLATLDRLRSDQGRVLDRGTPGQRKAVIESHVAEIETRGRC
ncbi:MAG TPA: hypothetical protein VGS60_18185 [Actinomycetes bacterium]|jgi:site-specific DNA recombinase|nr:hypothetical protein [Actinomycetes bacterium]